MINRLLLIILTILLISTSLLAQNSVKPVLFTIEDTPVSADEFKYVYSKNNSNNEDAFTKSDIDSYLELFINFKLKVYEARKLGYDTTKVYKEELKRYEDQLTKPYLTETEVTEQLLEEAYERMKHELDVSHILIAVSPGSSPEDTLNAYKKIIEVWNKAVKGDNFTELAIQYSDEPRVQETKGHLGFFTALQMVYPFENAAYSTKVNEVSKPFRTQFGFHILKVHDKRPSHGKVQISHIMLRFKPGMTKDDSIQLQNKIFEIYDQLIAGNDWDNLCKKYSEDYNSRERGGSLSAFGVGEMIPEIVEAAFSLKKLGDISDPVMTQLGWHILRLNGTTPLPPFEDYKAQLSRRIQADSRANKSKEALIRRLKKEDGFSENINLKEGIFSRVDSTTFSDSTSWDPGIDRGEMIFSLAGSTFTAGDFLAYINKNIRKSGAGSENVRINRLYKAFVEENLISYEKAHLEEKYEDFRYLMKEYREGILLFDIMEKEIWEKSGVDSTGLKKYYLNNLEDYEVKERASLITFDNVNNSELKSYLDSLTLISRDTTISLDFVKETIEKDFPDVKIKMTGAYEKGDAGWEDWMSEGRGIYTHKTSQGPEIVWITDFKPSTIPKLNEIKGIVISDYQDYMDKEWIESLKKKYKVSVNKAELKKLYKSLVQ